jgi:chitinase
METVSEITSKMERRVGQGYVIEISALKAVVLGKVISVEDLQDILARMLKAIKANKQETNKVFLIKMGIEQE